MNAKAPRWLRRLGRILLFSVIALVFLYVVAFLLTFTERYERVPDEIWESRDFHAIQTAANRRSSDTDTAFQSLLTQDAFRATTPPSPPALVNAADQWVTTVNRYNPEAILYHETDPLGNLYVMFGAWWSYLDGDAQVKALDGLGVAWRYHLRASLGEWDPSQGFEPGIVVVDTEGEVARNINGEIKIFRPTNINP